MKAWPTIPLGELCNIALGATPPRGSPRFWDEKRATGNIWLSIADMPSTINAVVSDSKEYLSDLGAARGKIVKRGTLLASFKLTLGRLAFAGCDLRTNEAIAALTIRKPSLIGNAYLYWFLTHFDWKKAAEGGDKVKGKTLNKEKLKILPVIVPPLGEQRRIVAVLDEAFAAIATATANAKKNLANARELFEAAFRERFDHVSNHWQRFSLSELAENWDYLRKPVTKSDRIPGDVPYYGASGQVDSVRDHLFDDYLLLISEDGANLLQRNYPIAFSISGKSWVNNHAHILKFEDMTTQRLVEYYINSISIAPWVNGMAQPKLNQKALNSIPVPLPPKSERAKLVGELDDFADWIARLEANQEQRLAALVGLKQSFLHRAFSGELTTSCPDLIPA